MAYVRGSKNARVRYPVHKMCVCVYVCVEVAICSAVCWRNTKPSNSSSSKFVCTPTGGGEGKENCFGKNYGTPSRFQNSWISANYAVPCLVCGGFSHRDGGEKKWLTDASVFWAETGVANLNCPFPHTVLAITSALIVARYYSHDRDVDKHEISLRDSPPRRSVPVAPSPFYRQRLDNNWCSSTSLLSPVRPIACVTVHVTYDRTSCSPSPSRNFSSSSVSF